MTPRAKWLGLLAWLAVSFLPALTGTITDTGPWFDSLEKPSWNPPNWVFGPVWTTLYAMMGVAAWRVWGKAGGFAQARTPLTLFLVHLIFNALWTVLFFGAHEVGLALADIVVLWVLILATLLLFWRRDVLAGVLLLPYLAWVTFATALNFAIWQMN